MHHASLSLNGRRQSMSFTIDTGRPAAAALDPGKAGTKTKVLSKLRLVVPSFTGKKKIK